jgi:hypothetical protein
VVQRFGRTRILIVAGALLALVVVVVIAVFAGGDRRMVNATQFNQVNLGDNKPTVSRTLGGAGESGSYKESSGVSKTEFSDCWYYDATGPREGTSTEVVMCFEDGALAMKSSPFISP